MSCSLLPPTYPPRETIHFDHCAPIAPFLKKNLFIYLFLFLAVLALHCSMQAFSSFREWRLLFIAVLGLLIAVVSLVVEHQLSGMRASVVVAHRLSCSMASRDRTCLPGIGK